MLVKNIVLVHGAFADGTSWSKIIPLLEAEGYNVVAVQNPLTSLADDVAATKRIIALQDGPVLLVGHSWGGAVISCDHPGWRRSEGCRSCVCSGLCTGGGTVCERCKHTVWMDGRSEKDSHGQREVRYGDFRRHAGGHCIRTANGRAETCACGTRPELWSYVRREADCCGMEDQALMGCHLGQRSDGSAGNGRIGSKKDRRNNHN